SGHGQALRHRRGPAGHRRRGPAVRRPRRGLGKSGRAPVSRDPRPAHLRRGLRGAEDRHRPAGARGRAGRPLMETTAHLDRFVLDHLPPPEQQPRYLFDRPELQYPPRLNAAVELLRRAIAAAGPGGRALIAYDHEFSWKRVDLISSRMAKVLVEQMGLVPGNRVLLHGPNSAWTVLAWFAILKAGGVVCATMPMLRAAELAIVIDKAQISHALVYD